MSSIGAGYDLSATTFSPDGRVYQVEYATKAVENSGTCVGIRCNGGVVLAVEKLLLSKMLCEGSNRRVHTVDRHVGMALAGLVADARKVLDFGRQTAAVWRRDFDDDIPPTILANRVGALFHVYTLYGHLRPFGAAVLLASIGKDGPELHMVEPNGHSFRYNACAIGKGKQLAKTELEKLKFRELSVRDALFEAARIIYTVHDDTKDKEFELGLSWICEETGNEHMLVPKDLRDEIDRRAKAAVEEAMDE